MKLLRIWMLLVGSLWLASGFTQPQKLLLLLGATKAPAPNQWLAYKARPQLAKVPAALPVRIAVDSKYWLWVNDSLVVWEGGLKRGPRPGDGYVDTLDLAPWLRPGENTLAVLVWYFGQDGFSHQNSGQPGLWFEAPGWEELAWRARPHPAFLPDTLPPFPNYRLPESNVVF
ncbi:MAG: glycoside hydrolase, partial [Bacteroidetes bacterium]